MGGGKRGGEGEVDHFDVLEKPPPPRRREGGGDFTSCGSGRCGDQGGGKRGGKSIKLNSSSKQ